MTPTQTDANPLLESQQFLQSAVHDLRAAQRTTGIAVEMLLQTTDEEVRRDAVAQIAQGLSKTEELLTGIGRYAAALAPSGHGKNRFAAARAVRFALSNLDKEIVSSGATVTLGDLPEIEGDCDRLAEVFEQLIGNSLKFRSGEKPAIHIAAGAIPGFWQFSVSDNGPGIPPKYRARLFIAFRRLHGADVPGVGLGLAICRKIIEADGGTIRIEGMSAQGNKISFTLPAADGATRA